MSQPLRDCELDGWDCLRALAETYGIGLGGVAARQPAEHPGEVSAAEMVAVAGAAGLPLELAELAAGEADQVPLPAAFELGSGRFLVAVAGRATGVQLIAGDRRRLTVPWPDLEARWTGRVLRLSLRDGGLAVPPGLRSLFAGLLRRHPGAVAELMAAMAMLHLFNLLVPLAFGVVIDKVYPHRGYASLSAIVIALVGIAVLECFFLYVREKVAKHLQGEAVIATYFPLLERTLRLPIRYHFESSAAEIAARLRRIPGTCLFYLDMLDILFVMPVFLVLALAAMLIYSQALTAFAVGAMVLQVALLSVLGPRLRRQARDVAKRSDDADARMGEALAGIATVKAYAAETMIRRYWERQMLQVLRTEKAGEWIALVIRLSNQFKSRITTVGVLWIGALEMFSGALSVGELVTFLMLLRHFNGMAERMSPLWYRVPENRAAEERIDSIIQQPAEGDERKLRSPRPHGSDIVFDGVRFGYHGNAAPLFQSLSLVIAAGSRVGVIGPSGSGKSTLIHLMQRLYGPSAGCITFGGVDLRDMDPRLIRQRIVSVSQDSHIFNLSVIENICLGRPGIEFDKVVWATTVAGIHHAVSLLPQGYDTVLEDRGRNLSSGQRQRIAIARALVLDPEVLVLDEATNALDYEGEVQLMERLNDAVGGGTLIVVTHRSSALRTVERVITVAQGRIVEDGAPDHLEAAGGIFATMLDHSPGRTVTGG